MVLAACGEVEKNGNLPDAGPVQDAPPTNARGSIQVTVLDPSATGAPAIGATVVFRDPDGTLVKKASTDAAGKASAEVLPGANVTAIVLANQTYQLQTVLAVKPGDDIVIGNKGQDTTALAQVAVAYPAFANAVYYDVAGPCGTTRVSPPPTGGPPPTTATLNISKYCAQTSMELSVTPLDKDFLAMATVSKTAIAYDSIKGAKVDIANLAYQAPQKLTAAYAGIDPITTQINLSRAVPDLYGASTTAVITGPGTTASVTINGASGSAASLASLFTNAKGSLQIVRQAVAGSTSTYGLDLKASLLPWIGTPSFDAANHKVLVPLDTTGTTSDKGDAFRASFNYSRTDANQVTTSYTWTVFGPEAGDIAIPALPDDLATIPPTADDNVRFPGTGMILWDSDATAGYDAIRNDLNAAFSTLSQRNSATLIRMSRNPIIRG